MRIDSIAPLGRIGLSGRSAATGCASPSAHPVGDAKMMRATVRQRTLHVVLTVFACTGLAAPAALAGTGGVLAASRHRAKPAQARSVHTTGIATWFGPGFYGKETACGQTMTPDIVGVANRTLPCGTLVKISYRARHLTVPVIDRGPYSHVGADWDLTAEAARALGVEDTVRIGTHIVGTTANTPTLGLPPGSPTDALTGGATAG